MRGAYLQPLLTKVLANSGHNSALVGEPGVPAGVSRWKSRLRTPSAEGSQRSLRTCFRLLIVRNVEAVEN